VLARRREALLEEAQNLRDALEYSVNKDLRRLTSELMDDSHRSKR
jgi:hypothetical protein